MENLVEITASLPADLVSFIQRQAGIKNVNAADILQQAIYNYKFLEEKKDAGVSVLLDEKGLGLRKVELPSA